MAFVQSNSGYTNGPITRTGVTAGNCLVAYIQGNSTLASTTLPAGWSKLTQATQGGTVWGCLWVYENHPGGNLSSAITSPPGDCGWSVMEYSGRATASVIDTQGNNQGTSTTWASASLTCAAGSDIAGGCGQEISAFTITYTAPATRRTLHSDHVHASGDLLNVSAGSNSLGGNVGASGHDWVACFVALKQAGGGGGADVSRFVRRRRTGLFVPHTSRRLR